MAHDGTNYYAVITEYDTKPGNIGSHFEFQNGRRILRNTRLNHMYHNEWMLKAHKQLSTYHESQSLAENVISDSFNGSHFEFRVNQES